MPLAILQLALATALLSLFVLPSALVAQEEAPPPAAPADAADTRELVPLRGRSSYPSVEAMLEEFVAVVAKMPFVEVEMLRHGRHEAGYSIVAAGPHSRWYAAAQAAVGVSGLGERLLPYLEDDDPRLRLMTAYALYRSLEPRWLPVLGSLTADRAPIKVIPPFSMAYGADGEPLGSVEFEQVAVGDIVAALLGGWGGPPADAADFGAWCTRQQELHPTVAALRLRVEIACYGISSTSSWPVDRMVPAFHYCSGARPGLREIAPVALFHDRWRQLAGGFPLVEQYLVMGVRRLGRDNVLRLLRHEAPIVLGEELPPDHFEGLETGFAMFVLERPGDVGLLPSDADLLLALAEKMDDQRWARGAARLDPSRAVAILHAVIDADSNPMAGWERAQSARLLWELGGVAEADYLASWFYDVKPSPLGYSPGVHMEFLIGLLHRYRSVDRALFRRIVLDDRFERVAPQAILSLVHTLNLTSMTPVVPREDFLNFMHPWGIDRAFTSREEAMEQMPGPTRLMLDQLDRIRAKIRAHVAAWSVGED